MAIYTGKQKLEFCGRLGDDWQKLADYFEIPPDKQHAFDSGKEPRAVWEWLEERKKLSDLPRALEYLSRSDLVVEVLRPVTSPELSRQATWQGSPYPGLRHLTEEDAPIFFGRDAETTQLLDRLQRERFVAVVGASGSGKSSLVAAGLLPRLHEIPGGEQWERVRFTPGGLSDDPFLALAAKLEPGLERRGFSGRQIADKLRARGDLTEFANLLLEGRPPEAELLLFIDQFEELFTQTKPEHHHRFTLMLERAAQAPRLRTVLTVRADFYDHCVNHAALAKLLRVGSFPLAAPEMPALLEMITGPAELAGLHFDKGLPGRILRDTGNEPGALALMAFALSELYEACKTDKSLSSAAYDSFGRVQGAIAKRADCVYSELDDKDRTAFGYVFKELVDVDPERGVPTRKRALKSRFGDSPPAERLIEEFTRARLFVCSVVEEREVVEVAHEALLTKWPQLNEWIKNTFDDLRLLHHLKLEAAEWERAGHKETHRWPHERLVPVYEMVGRLKPDLSEEVRQFIRPEAERLLEEIARATTSHQRRAVIGDRLAAIGDTRPGVGLDKRGLPDFDWCGPVPGGRIELEEKAGTFVVEPFYISRYPVTWAQYRCLVEAEDGYRNVGWWKGLAQRQDDPGVQYRQVDNHPAENVSWYDAVAFCRWLSKRLGYEFRLSTEWEWQQAATGGNPANKFPWGEWNPLYANTWESGLSRTTAVGLYPQGAAPVGALDMSGNISEWCLNEYDSPSRTDLSGKGRRVVRGGSWRSYQDGARAASRDSYFPDSRDDDFGFRVVSSSPIFLKR